MSITKRLIISYIFYFIAAFGVSLSIEANIGVGSLNTVVLPISKIFTIKEGYSIILLNMIFMIMYMIMTKFKYKIKYIVQIVSIIFFGSVINLFLYNIYPGFEITSYPIRVIMLTLGTSIGGLSIGVIVALNAMTFPVESFCHQLENMKIISFVKARYGLDVIFISSSLILSTAFSLDYFVREGTLISMILLSFMMHTTKSFTERKFLT
jgi:uncharacterized membrane protein YczE